MIIRAYEPTETNFNHNKYVLGECIKLEMEETKNGMFLVTVEYPLLDKKGIGNLLTRGWVIKVPTPDSRKDQLFRITEIEKNTNANRVNLTAKSIGITDLGSNFILDTNIVAKTRLEALQQILDRTMDTHSFTADGDTTTAQNNLRIVRYSPIQAIFGSDKNTMVNRYGGDYVLDNFVIHALETRASGTTYEINHTKNLNAITESVDDTNLVTRIIPIGTNELMLPETYINSPKINNYERVYNKLVHFEQIGVDENTTEEEAIEKLRAAANEAFTVDHLDDLEFNYKIDFVELSKTEEYKNYKHLQTVQLGDNVTIKHGPMGLNLNGQVIYYRYDVLAQKYLNIEVGVKKQNIIDTLNDTEIGITKLTDQLLQTVISDGKIKSIVTQNATSWGLSFNGYVKGTNYLLDGTGMTVTAGDITVKNAKDEVILWVDDNTGVLSANAINIFGDGGNTINFGGNGSKFINFKSEDGYNLFINFQRGTDTTTRIGIYGTGSGSARSDQLFIEPGSTIEEGSKPAVIMRGANSTAIANEMCQLEVHGDIYAIDKLFVGSGSNQMNVREEINAIKLYLGIE